MEAESIVFSVFLIFAGAAVLSTIALFGRQPLLVAYIVLGILFGQHGLKLVSDASFIEEISHIGIIFLLFLLGLDLQPANLVRMLHKTTPVAIVSCLLFAAVGYVITFLLGYTHTESLIVGATMMFSSTIIGIKLLPTTVLHHKQTGEIVVSLLLLQDIAAILMLIFLNASPTESHHSMSPLFQMALTLPGLSLFAFGFVRYVLLPLLRRFDRFHEYIFLIAIGWCLGLAETAYYLGLSLEIGAFIAGVSLASSRISQYMANNLRPLRDFFLIMFFFTIGAQFNIALLPDIWVGALILGLVMLTLKPAAVSFLLQIAKQKKSQAWEVGFRLGQVSEFSLLIAFVAAGSHIGELASHLIQATTILTFIVSSYIVVFRYPTPIALSNRLRRD